MHTRDAALDDEPYYRHLNIPGADLRISITADCNMRCTYCHNEGQGDFAKVMMSEGDLRKIVSTGVRFGVNKVRLTGGEPMLHPDLERFIKILKLEYRIDNVGLNTNGTMLSGKRLAGLREAGLDVVVVGVDFPSATVSKDSPRGRGSTAVLRNIESAIDAGLNVQIASVFSGSTTEDVDRLFEWCGERGVLLKILEVSSDETAPETSQEFLQLVEHMRQKHDLRMGRTVSLNERFGVSPSGQRVLFFHSHCRIRECHECSQMHMRVTTSGLAKPCILRGDTEFDLLGADPETAMRRAVHNLGNPPERPAR